MVHVANNVVCEEGVFVSYVKKEMLDPLREKFEITPTIDAILEAFAIAYVKAFYFATEMD